MSHPPAEKGVVIDAKYADHFAPDTAERAEIVQTSISFRDFLNYWHFTDRDTGEVKILGHVLWPAQEQFVRVAEAYWWIYYLKARQLGESTIECAYDAFVLRFRNRGVNARVHIFSKRDDSAQELLEVVKFGLERLPEEWKLGVVRNTTHEYAISAGPEDVRLVKAYPADKNPSRGATCVHAHLDEWAFMGDPRRVWQAIQPSAAGSVHFVTTGEGPTNWTSSFWLKCLAGDISDRRGEPIHPCFIGALNRPDRTEAWLKAQRAGMDEQAALWEFPLKWEDALSGGGEFVFQARDLRAAVTYARGFMTREQGSLLKRQPRKYVKAWDIGRHKDAAVGIVLDITEDVMDVVAYQRLRGVRYPQIQMEIEIMHRAYPGITAIEKNSAGEAVLENLNLPEHELEGFSTTGQTKPRIISQLQVAMQNWLIRWDPEECHQLDAEMRSYQLPDENVTQDSVIALAIALEYAGMSHMRQGTVLSVIQV